jgi:hypothetical protein
LSAACFVRPVRASERRLLVKNRGTVRVSAAEIAANKGDARIAAHFHGQKILQYQ